MIRSIETEDDIAEGVRFLSGVEPRFAEVAALCGPPPLRRGQGGLAGLLAIITEQQISIHAAAAIWARVEARFAPFPVPELLSAADEDYLACGLSRPKLRTIRAVLAWRELPPKPQGDSEAWAG